MALRPSLQNYMLFDCLLFLSMAQQALVGQGLFNIESSLWHSDTPHSVGLLWTSDEIVEETSTYTTHNTHKGHLCPNEIRTRNPRKRAAADPRFKRRGYRDWLRLCIEHRNPVLLLYQHDAPSSYLHRASVVSKTLFIVPTDAHYYKIIEMLKQYENYYTCSDMFRFTQEPSSGSSPVLRKNYRMVFSLLVSKERNFMFGSKLVEGAINHLLVELILTLQHHFYYTIKIITPS